MSRGPLRPIAAPFVVTAPTGARVRTRLVVNDTDAAVLSELGRYLGSLAGHDLARRCREGRLDAKGRAVSRRERKRSLTAVSSSRWAGAITRTTEDSWQLGSRNLVAEGRSLRARCRRIEQRLAVPIGERRGRRRGYGSQAERFTKQQRLQGLRARLGAVESRVRAGRVSVCRGGARLARGRHQLQAARADEDAWRGRWESARMFIIADGDACKPWGNETIRWNPDEQWLEIKLPPSMSRLANRPHGRYRLSCAVAFRYRAAEVGAQAASGAVRYDVVFDPGRGRWYLDASWKTPQSTPTVEELRFDPVLAVDVNGGHLACVVLDPAGNPLGPPRTIPLETSGLPSARRDGRTRAAISELLRMATAHGCSAVVIENLDFAEARAEGRESSSRRPSRGRRGRSFRRMVAGIPTGRFRDRLTQMAVNRGLAVIAVDPAYTSMWGAEHWLAPLRQTFSPGTAVSGHHAAALVIGRRGLGQRARRRGWCDRDRPEDRDRRAADSAVGAIPALSGLPEPRLRETGTRQARGQPHERQKTGWAERASPGDQGGEDRSRHPVVAMSYSLPR